MKPEILLAVLDWGLGHATRCVPIVRELQRQGATVVVGGSGFSLELLMQEFPGLDYLELPSYQISYPHKGNMGWHFLKALPRIQKIIAKEHEVVNHFLESKKLTAIISDNRYGCYSSQLPSVFVGHQLNVRMPKGWSWASPLANRWHQARLSKFNVGWIPDDEGVNLAGNLTSQKPSNFSEIGVLSRFSVKRSATAELEEFEIVAIVSGPEPARQQFETLLRSELKESGRKCLLVKGLSGSMSISTAGNWNEVNHLPTTTMAEVIQKCNMLICRSGYSTIMDLAALAKPAVFVPTPGQPEQEYLARHMETKGRGLFVPQHQLNLENVVEWKRRLLPLESIAPNNKLAEAVKQIL